MAKGFIKNQINKITAFGSRNKKGLLELAGGAALATAGAIYIRNADCPSVDELVEEAADEAAEVVVEA